MRYVVFGATGQLGSFVIDSLKQEVPAESILALGRNEDALSDLATRGVTVGKIDYKTPTTVSGVLKAGDRVLLISSSEVGQRFPQHSTVIQAAKDAGVAGIVYTSLTSATTSKSVLASEHKATEKLLAEAGIPFTVLRNNWYTENHIQDFQQAVATGAISNNYGSGKIASAPRKDYAEAAAKVLATSDFSGKVFELGGDSAWDYAEFAATVGEVLGKSVDYTEIGDEEQQSLLEGFGLDQGTAGFVTALGTGIREGALDLVTGDLSKILGRATETLKESLQGWA